MDNNNPRQLEDEEYGREQTAEARRASLPSFLQFSDEQIEAARLDNARVLAESNHPFLRQSPQDAQRTRAIREESDWRRTLSMLDFEIAAAAASLGVVTSSNPLAQRRDQVAQTLAENLAAQGRFGEAADVAAHEDQQREYLELAAAVQRPDDEWCGPECEAFFANDPTRLTREDIVAEVFSIKHGRVLPAVKCHYCHSLNVKPAPAEHLRLRGMRARARALTEGMTPARAAETLQREKITAKDIFK